MTRTLSRYFARRFFVAVAMVFAGIFVLVAFVDYVDSMRKAGSLPDAPVNLVIQMSIYRVPQIVERLQPFSVLVGAMICFFSLSRRMELVVARGAGISAWQIVTPAMLVALCLGVFGTTVYDPVAASLAETSKRIEAQLFGDTQAMLATLGGGYWVRQRGGEGESILNALQSREQGLKLTSITAFAFHANGEFAERIEAQTAELIPGAWRLTQAHVFAPNAAPRDLETYMLPTRLTREQVAESFAAPDTVGFWNLPTYIRYAEDSGFTAGGYRLQYQILIARPFLLAAMILLAASVSMRAFRFGGVPQRILIGVAAGFSIYVLSKVSEDLSKAELLYPLVAAWLPVAAGGLSGFLVLLYEEDG